MASELDSLNFEIKGNIATTMNAIKELGSKLDDVFKQVDQIDVAFRNLGQSMGLPAAQVELLMLRVQPLVNTLAKADKQAASLEESFTRKLMQKALEDHNKKVITLADGTQRARYEMVRLADASQQLRIPTQAPRAPAQQQATSGGVNFVRITAATSQLGMLARVSATMRTVATSVTTVNKATTIAASSMDRFRMGLAAPKVNPEMNVIKSGIDKVGDAAANGINKVREIADAVASDIPGTVGSAVGAMGKVNVELDKTSATVSKHVSKMQSSSKGLTFLGTVFPFLKTQINSVQEPFDKLKSKAEQAANKLDQANAEVSATANKLRNARFIMDGTFQSLGGSADMFARAAFHANLPVRLLKREWEGATRVVRAATHVWNFATHPIHKATLAIGHSRAQYKVFRSSLPQLTGGLQLGTRLFRGFAHATYFTGPAATLATKAVKGLARGVWSMISPAKTAATSLLKLTGVQSTFIGKALGMKPAADQAAASMAKIGSASAGVGSMFGGLKGKAVAAALGVTAAFVGMVGVGASTAMATEKNNVVFGTMLHDMEQGAAVVKSLQSTQAAGLFDNQELLDSGRLLFKAGVSAQDLAAKTDQLATIATATSTELGDLTRIYQQGANAGSFGLDKINQLAERGIDIYGGLTAATGKSGGELKKMISDGQIGLSTMDAALAHLTDGHGIYAGAIGNVAGTASGMMSLMKNNTQQALGQLMGYGLGVFKPILAAGVAFTDKLKLAISTLEPVFAMYSGVISSVMSSAWTAISETALGAFSLIAGDGILTFDSILSWIARMYGAASFIFSNLGTIASYAWLAMKLGAVMAFNDIIYFFTDSLPAYLNWFGANWASVFLDAGTVIVTVFTNITKNIKSAMSAIWEYIKSGGTSDLQFAFVPLLDGFKSTVAELPNVPERALTQLEQQMTNQLGAMGKELGNGLQQAMDDAAALVGTNKPKEITDTKTAATGSTAAASAARKAAENRAIGVRSAEGQSVVAQMSKIFGKNDKEKKAQDAQIQQAKDIKDIAREVRRGKPLIAKAF